jgi:CrcB protein
MQQVLIVGAGGFFGAISRYLVARLTSGLLGSFPLGTLLVNVSGSFLIALILYSASFGTYLISPEFRNFATIGFIGAFTTMSTLAYETFHFTELSDYLMAGLNIGLNITLCLLAIYLGKETATLISR